MNTYDSFEDLLTNLKEKYMDRWSERNKSRQNSHKLYMFLQHMVTYRLLSLIYKNKDIDGFFCDSYRCSSEFFPKKHYDDNAISFNNTDFETLVDELRKSFKIKKNHTYYNLIKHFIKGKPFTFNFYVDYNYFVENYEIITFLHQYIDMIDIIELEPTFFHNIFGYKLFIDRRYKFPVTYSEKQVIKDYIDNKIKPFVDDLYETDAGYKYIGTHKDILSVFNEPMKINEYEIDVDVVKILFKNHFSNFRYKREMLYIPMDYINKDDKFYQYLLCNYDAYFKIFLEVCAERWNH